MMHDAPGGAMNFAVIGVGGFGAVHVATVEALAREGLAKLVAVSEIDRARNEKALSQLDARGVRCFSNWRDMLDGAAGIQVVTVAAPFHFHREMASEALAKGFDVICEKPADVTVQNVQAMVDAEAASGRRCATDFQMVTGEPMRKLKELLHDGPLGSPLEVIALGPWSRDDGYYARAPWAGRLKMGDRWVLDGPVNNALSHLLNNCLLIASPSWNELANPLSVRAELYRAHPQIEAEDTVSAHVRTAEGVDVYYYATYCMPGQHDLSIEVVAQHGRALWSEGRLAYWLKSGETCDQVFSDPEKGNCYKIFRNAIEVFSGGRAHLALPLRESLKLVRAQNGCYLSAGEVVPVGQPSAKRYPRGDSVATIIEGLGELMRKCAADRKLFSEAGAPWARSSHEVEVHELMAFEGAATFFSDRGASSCKKQPMISTTSSIC